MSISSTNPSHVLIARNSRSPANPHTTTRLPNPFPPHHRSSSSLLFGETDDIDFLRDGGGAAGGAYGGSGLRQPVSATTTDNEQEDEEEDLDFEVERTFLREKTSDVKVTAGVKEFWVHSVPLRFSCTFFQSILEGNWAESSTAHFRPASPSTISHLSVCSSTLTTTSTSTSTSDSQKAPQDDVQTALASMSLQDSDVTGQDSSTETEARMAEVDETQIGSGGEKKTRKKKKQKRRKSAVEKVRKEKDDGVYASIVLPAGEAGAFHDFLHHLYPHLTLSIHWHNVEPLIMFAHKYSVDSLLALCTSFLSSYAAGNPIKAMSIAEMLSLPDLYKEGSKFVLDNLTGWNATELDTLSHETRWKLEKKRSWFLERLLKLSLTNVARDYPCATTCPDPTHCARLLEEKWRQAYFAANRFGSPSPSITYRYLRQLDVPPFLMLERSACDSFARGWVLDLFDRMFSLPLAANSTGPGVGLLNSKYFLSISLA